MNNKTIKHAALSLSLCFALSATAQEKEPEPNDPSKKYVEQKGSQGFILRRDPDDAKIAKGSDGSTPDKVKGALFSFRKDFESQIEQTVAQGVIGISKSYTWNVDYEDFDSDTPAFLDYTHAFSVLFDKSDVGGGGDGKGETDVLGFDATASYHYDFPGTGPGRLADSALLTFKLSDSTDFDVDRHVLGGQFDLEPINGLLSGQMLRQLNFGQRIGLRLYPRWMLHAEAGSIVNPLETETVTEEKEFARAGAKVTCDLFFGTYEDPVDGEASKFKDRFKLSASFLHYEGLTTGVQSSTLFTAGADYRWPDYYHAKSGTYRASPLSLSVAYRRGEIPFAQEEVDALTVGFGIRF